jgi:hypothetical protein
MMQGFISTIYPTTARVVSSIATSGSAVTVTNGSPSDFLSLSVPAGRWMLFGNFCNSSGGSHTYYNVWISTTSATYPDRAYVAKGSNDSSVTAPMQIMTLAATTTVYLSVWMDTANTLQGQFYAIELL